MAIITITRLRLTRGEKKIQRNINITAGGERRESARSSKELLFIFIYIFFVYFASLKLQRHLLTSQPLIIIMTVNIVFNNWIHFIMKLVIHLVLPINIIIII